MRNTFLFVVVSALCAAPAFASTTYAGTDTACFYGILSSSCTASAGTTGIGIDAKGNSLLTYTPASGFSTTDATSPIQVDLGTFTVTKTFAGVEGGTFDLNVAFTQPSNSGPQQAYSASTLGAVLFDLGGAEITFNQPTVEAFNGFDLSLPSSAIDVKNGQSVTLYGTITPMCGDPATAPEPAYVSAAGAAVLLIGAFRRRKAARATASA